MNIRIQLKYITIVNKMLLDPWKPAVIDRWRTDNHDTDTINNNISFYVNIKYDWTIQNY